MFKPREILDSWRISYRRIVFAGSILFRFHHFLWSYLDSNVIKSCHVIIV